MKKKISEDGPAIKVNEGFDSNNWLGDNTPKKEEAYDFVNPNHYKKGNKEVFEMMIDIWGKDAYIAHCEMCAFKYRMRLGEKPDQPVDRDLDKAKWYEAKAKELRPKINEAMQKAYNESVGPIELK